MAEPFLDRRRGVNVNFTVGGALGFVGYALWPTDPLHGLEYLLPSMCLMSAAHGARLGISGLVTDYRERRLSMASATEAPGRHGKARFATTIERQRAGLHDPAGIALLGLANELPAFLPGARMLLVEALTGSGKSSRLIASAIWHALHTGRSVVVSDPKPELVYMLAGPLRERGFRVIINNPIMLPGLPHDDANPFADLKAAVADPALWVHASPIADSIALSLLPEIKDSKNRYFEANDRGALSMALLGLAAFEPHNCTPAGAFRALTDPRRFKQLLRTAMQSDVLDGDLQAEAANLIRREEDNPEHFESARTGARNALSAFKPSSALGRIGETDSFDPRSLRDREGPPTVVFDVMRPDLLDVFGKANELTQTSRLRALKKASDGREVVFIVDEATALPVRSLAADIEIMRSLNLRLITAYQSEASLDRIYGKERADTLRINSIRLFFSVSSLKTADELARAIGDTTIGTENWSISEDRKPSRSFSEASRKLLATEEVLSLPQNVGLLMVPGMRPVLLKMLPWYRITPLKDLFGDNPHERHARSTVSDFTLRYGKNARELGPPVIPDMKARLRRAAEFEQRTTRKRRVPWLRARKLLWLPLLAVLFGGGLTGGTPHLLVADTRLQGGGHGCLYLGVGGSQKRHLSTPCPLIGWLPPHAPFRPAP